MKEGDHIFKAKEGLSLQKFREEIGRLKTEREEGRLDGMFELLSINPEDLTLEDAEVWQKVIQQKAENFSKVDLASYQQKIKTSKNSSREQFLGLIKNKISPIWTAREMKNWQ